MNNETFALAVANPHDRSFIRGMASLRRIVDPTVKGSRRSEPPSGYFRSNARVIYHLVVLCLFYLLNLSYLAKYSGSLLRPMIYLAKDFFV